MSIRLGISGSGGGDDDTGTDADTWLEDRLSTLNERSDDEDSDTLSGLSVSGVALLGDNARLKTTKSSDEPVKIDDEDRLHTISSSESYVGGDGISNDDEVDESVGDDRGSDIVSTAMQVRGISE